MDGLIDTCDAIFSYGDKEKKLEILKDPRTGAFGVMGCAVYLLFLLGIANQLLQSPRYALLLSLIFFISRSIGAIALLSVKKAKSTGLGSTFAEAANNKLNLIILSLYLLGALMVICFIHVVLGMVFLLVLGSYFFYYVRYIKKSFGGITGDLTGFLILFTELIMYFITAFSGILG